MKLTQSKLKLIEKAVKNNPEYSKNEDLFDTFVQDICERTKKIINSVDSTDEIEKYINKIARTSMLKVLKKVNRLKYHISEQPKAVQTITTITHPKDYSAEKVSYNEFTFETPSESIVAPNEILGKITDIVSKIDDDEPNNQFLKIYKLRYDNGLTQNEIAEMMNLSQSEVRIRLFRLLEKVKKLLN